MGKYDRLKGVVPTHREATDDARQRYQKWSIEQLMEKFLELKNKKEALKDQLSEIEPDLAALTEIFLETLEEKDLTSLKSTKFGTFSTRESVYVSVKDRDVLHAWLRDNNYGDMIKEQVHPTALNSLFSEILLTEGLPKDSGVEFFIKPKIAHKAQKGTV